MPGSGKSTIGQLLAIQLDFEFIDTDRYIEEQEQMSLQEILDIKGIKEFIKIEQGRILELLPLKKHIIAPGGSVIYSNKVMEAIQKSSVIIFLDVPLKILQSRLNNKETRGIVGLKNISIKDLYEERLPLYKKYADIVVFCAGKSPSEITNEIIQKL
jgi:shikimate kinase